MKNSIRIRLFIILSAFVVGIISFYYVLNTLAFEKFYTVNKKNLLVKTYMTINDLYKENTSDIELELERLDVNKSLNIMITNGESIIFSREKGEYNRVAARRPRQFQNMPLLMPDAKELYRDENCVVQKGYDRFFRSYHIDLAAKLDNGYVLFIRSPMESITESVRISNKFIIIAGFIALFAGAFIVLYISRSFTKPILQLSGIANEMAHLNFDVKYNVKGQDEINDLGNSINSLSQKLEKTISELKTANAQLEKDIEVKNSIDEMRRGFLSNVSHELKTPISLIQGYAEGLRDNVASDEASRQYYCGVILDESEKMDLMIKKLLSLMQIESGQDQVTIRRFDVTELIDSLMEKNRICFEQNDINVVFNPKEKVFVWGDEFLVEDVLSNYLSNAINHVDDKRTIEFKTENKEKTVRISVYNTGSHIPEGELDKIWESFYKVDKARTRKYGGSGIGLAVVSAIMKAMGKPYGARNVEGGVEFYIELDG